jgi:hypothetical protein
MEAEKILGSFRPKEHDALMTGNLLNGGRLNQVFEHMGISYASHPLPGTEASSMATRKQKDDMSKKATAKKLKVAQSSKAMPTKTIAKRSIIKVIHPKAKPRPKGTFEIELILVKPIRVSKTFCFSDVLDSFKSQCDEGQRMVENVVEQAPRVITFDNLGDDSSPDIRCLRYLIYLTTFVTLISITST